MIDVDVAMLDANHVAGADTTRGAKKDAKTSELEEATAVLADLSASVTTCGAIVDEDHEEESAAETNKSGERRPTLLLLGDSRSRWWLFSMAQQLCDQKLSCYRYGGVPRCNFSAADEPIVAALHGQLNWRSGGGFLCSSDSALSSVGYYVHYGVSPSGLYQRNRVRRRVKRAKRFRCGVHARARTRSYTFYNACCDNAARFHARSAGPTPLLCRPLSALTSSSSCCQSGHRHARQRPGGSLCTTRSPPEQRATRTTSGSNRVRTAQRLPLLLRVVGERVRTKGCQR